MLVCFEIFKSSVSACLLGYHIHCLIYIQCTQYSSLKFCTFIYLRLKTGVVHSHHTNVFFLLIGFRKICLCISLNKNSAFFSYISFVLFLFKSFHFHNRHIVTEQCWGSCMKKAGESEEITYEHSFQTIKHAICIYEEEEKLLHIRHTYYRNCMQQHLDYIPLNDLSLVEL